MCYYQTAGAGFVTSEISWFNAYETMGSQGLSNAFGDGSLRYVSHFFGYFLWKTLGFNGTGWMLVFTTLHAVIGLLAFIVFDRLFSVEEIKQAPLIAFVGSLLFVLSPYNTEPLVWYACLSYLLCSFFLLISTLALLRYLREGGILPIAGFYLFYLLAVFTLEISFAYPFILLVFFLLWPPATLGGKNRLALVARFSLPSFVFVPVYFLTTFLLRGNVLAHYGLHPRLRVDEQLVMSNLCKYAVKVLTLSQFFNYERRNEFYVFFDEADFSLIIFVLIFMVLGLILFFDKFKKRTRILMLLFAFFCLSLSPILHHVFSFVLNIEGDRYTYFASIFGYQLLVLLCVTLLGNLGWIIPAVMLFFSVKFLNINTGNWIAARTINEAIVRNFHYQKAEHICLLNTPDNFNGAYIFRSYLPKNSFAETIKLRTGNDITGKTVELMQFHMGSAVDSVSVGYTTDSTFQVTLGQMGTWLMRNGIGVHNYKSKNFRVNIDSWGLSYTVTFKNKTPNTTYLYLCGTQWRRFDYN